MRLISTDFPPVFSDNEYFDEDESMLKKASWTTLSLLWLLSACVTINVYFPAAAAEKAADRIIEEIWGKLPADATQKPSDDSGSVPPQSFNRDVPIMPLLVGVLDFFIAPAAAQDLNVSTPAINQIKSAMAARHRQLEPYYNSGAVGLTGNGDIAVRDLNAVALNERNQVKQLVAQENGDRSRLYHEIAQANGHPEWEKDIRQTFAREWIQKARSGWWYQSGGWKQK
jgi:uncharacterized protein YdbL (DUF1318 family)